MTKSFAKENFGHVKIASSRGELRNYDQSTLSDVQGTLRAEVSFQGRTADLTFYVVPDRCTPVLSKYAIHALQLQLDPTQFSVKAVQIVSLDQLISKYPKLTSGDVGTFPGYQHRIELDATAMPKVTKLRTVPLALQDRVTDEVKKVENDKIWESCPKTDWQHGLVAVMKPNGNVRITTDLSPLNAFVIPDRYPLPTPQDIFHKLSDCNVFSRLDLERAYFSIELHPESRPLTATITSEGIFQYRKLPMGLKDSASAFQCCVDQTLQDIPHVGNYIDDIIVGGVTIEEHDENLEKVLDALEKSDFRLNPAKCDFRLAEIGFLGHVISNKGIRPNPRRVEVIANADPPKNLKELQRFLGFINYYNTFIPHLATKAEPLRKLTRKDERFVWDKSCEEAFQSLKEDLCKRFMTAHFQPDCPTILTTDASGVSLGAVLSQIQVGKEVPIAFASHTLQPSERNYAASEAEALGCVWGCEHFEKFLLGRHFTLRTDNSALTTLLQRSGTSKKGKKFFRWHERLSAFDYTVQHCKGTSNVAADMLFRFEKSVASPVMPPTIKTVTHNTGLTAKTIATEVGKDHVLQVVLRFIAGSTKLPRTPDTQPYRSIFHDLYSSAGIVYRRDGRIVLHGSLRRRVLTLAHEGHPGIVQFKRLLRNTHWWPGLCQDIERMVRGCRGCQASEKSDSTPGIVGCPFPNPTRPFQDLCIDITGPFATAPHNKRHIVAMLDRFSSYPEYALMGSIDSKSIIRFLETVFSRYGYPASILSDNGPQFVSVEFEQYLTDNGIAHRTSPVYCPQTNGRIENFNGYLKHGCQTFSDDATWDKNVEKLIVEKLIRSYRPTPRDSGKSPSELLHGWPMRMPFQPPAPTEPVIMK